MPHDVWTLANGVLAIAGAACVVWGVRIGLTARRGLNRAFVGFGVLGFAWAQMSSEPAIFFVKTLIAIAGIAFMYAVILPPSGRAGNGAT